MASKSRHLATKFFSKCLFSVIQILFRQLRSISVEKASELTRSITKEGSRGLAPSPLLQPDAFKTTRLESLTGWASPVDTMLQRDNALSREHLPKWAQEITPFLANQLSVHTRRAYETDLKQFFRFLEGRIDPREFAQLRAEHIILFRKSLEEGRLTGRVMGQSTINRKLAVVKSFFTWLKTNHVVGNNPAEHVKGYPQTQESSLKGLSDEEAKRILLLPNLNKRAGALHSAILHLLLYLGVRKSELLGLKMGDLDEERGVSVIKVRGKGHRVRILPTTERVRAALEHYFMACGRDKALKEEPLFIPTKNPRSGMTLKMMNPNAITYIVIRYAKKAGILKYWLEINGLN